jgi:hypothetical protein
VCATNDWVPKTHLFSKLPFINIIPFYSENNLRLRKTILLIKNSQY